MAIKYLAKTPSRKVFIFEKSCKKCFLNFIGELCDLAALREVIIYCYENKLFRYVPKA